MSADDIQREWNYIYTERLGMLCEDRTPNQAEIAEAKKTADEAAGYLAREFNVTSIKINAGIPGRL